MSTVVQGILLAVIGVLLFGLIIFIHEFGHFFTAKLSHVCVNEFSIGMGPKLFSFTRGETQYSLRLLPIGGYCAMEGEDEKSDDPLHRRLHRSHRAGSFLCFKYGGA